MSHFCMGIIIPRGKLDEENIKDYIDNIMEYYDETLSVPGHVEQCWCVGRKAKDYAYKQVEKEMGTIDKVRDKFWKDNEEIKKEMESLEKIKNKIKKPTKKQIKRYRKLENQTDKMWEEALKPREKREKEIIENHKDKGKPDKKCPECKGKGEYQTQYNPNAKWDWYRIGGRWDGCLTLNKQTSQNGFNFDNKHETIENNSVNVKEHLKNIKKDFDEHRCFGLIDKDGNWIEKGNMGWWGCVANEKEPEKWKELYIRTLKEASPEDIIVAVDCHI